MVGAPLPSSQPEHLSATDEALSHESTLRLALRDISDTLPDDDDRRDAVTRTVKAVLPDDLVQTRPLLRAMRQAVLASLTTLAPTAAGERSSTKDNGDGEENDESDEKDNDNDDDNDNDNDNDKGNDDAMDDDDAGGSGRSNGTSNGASGDMLGRARDEDLDAVKRAARALDHFVSVSVIGARAKVSAFFDHQIVHTEWTRIAVVAGSSVAEAAFLAVNHPKKSLTVLDLPPHWPGRAMAHKLACQTGAAVRYAAVTASHRALEGVDVVVMGAREVLANGAVVVAGGCAIVAHMAQEAGVPVMVVTQSAKVSERGSVEWAEGESDVLKAKEVQRLVMELEGTLPERVGVTLWRTDLAPEVFRRREGGGSGTSVLTN